MQLPNGKVANKQLLRLMHGADFSKVEYLLEGGKLFTFDGMLGHNQISKLNISFSLEIACSKVERDVLLVSSQWKTYSCQRR